MNVLVYVLDALRADHVSCYGYDRETTPRIDELADEWIVYRNAFSPATWTKPVGASLLTGAYPPVHGARSREDVFNADVTRLPELLAPHGIYSVGFSTMGNVSASLGYGREFDEYHDLYKDPEIVKRRKTQDIDSEELDHEAADEIALPRAEDLSEHVIDWLKQNTDTDFFAFCWSIEPHIPYDPPDGHRQFVDPEYDGPVDGERESLSAVKTDADRCPRHGVTVDQRALQPRRRRPDDHGCLRYRRAARDGSGSAPSTIRTARQLGSRLLRDGAS